MFWYFPTNYVWNLAINISMQMGAEISEIEAMCRPLIEISERGDDEGTRLFLERWEHQADNLVAQAQADKAKGRPLSAANKLKRAANYYITAERLQASSDTDRIKVYNKMRASFDESMVLGRENCVRVEIPYQGSIISGLYTRAEGVEGKAPVLLHVNGLDSTKEILYLCGSAQQLAKKGVSSLCIDQPGTGEALRYHGLKARYDSEVWAGAVIDWLEQRSDVDPSRIGCWGVSLGGYFCPRAVAMEPRFALGCVVGSNHNWYEVQLKRQRREGDRPVPHYWEHVRWVWGGEDTDAFMEVAKRVQLNGVLHNIKVPFLVTHGGNDRQIPLEYAHQTFEQLTDSPKKELVIFDEYTGGREHASCDNMRYCNDLISDWVSETFEELKQGQWR